MSLLLLSVCQNSTQTGASPPPDS